jgi:hypothetical protein
MHLMIEVWNAKPAWLALSQEERGAYMANIGPAIEQLLGAGVEIVGWGSNDADTSNRANYQYFAVWKMPNKEIVNQFEQAVEQAGWYNYFDQYNLRGEIVPVEQVIGEHVALAS